MSLHNSRIWLRSLWIYESMNHRLWLIVYESMIHIMKHDSWSSVGLLLPESCCHYCVWHCAWYTGRSLGLVPLTDWGGDWQTQQWLLPLDWRNCGRQNWCKPTKLRQGNQRLTLWTCCLPNHSCERHWPSELLLLARCSLASSGWPRVLDLSRAAQAEHSTPWSLAPLSWPHLHRKTWIPVLGFDSSRRTGGCLDVPCGHGPRRPGSAMVRHRTTQSSGARGRRCCSWKAPCPRGISGSCAPNSYDRSALWLSPDRLGRHVNNER